MSLLLGESVFSNAPGQMEVERWPELRKALADAFASKPRDEWAAIFEGTVLRVCWACVGVWVGMRLRVRVMWCVRVCVRALWHLCSTRLFCRILQITSPARACVFICEPKRIFWGSLFGRCSLSKTAASRGLQMDGSGLSYTPKLNDALVVCNTHTHIHRHGRVRDARLRGWRVRY